MQDCFECAKYADFPRPFPSYAMGASPRLSREDINALPLFHYTGKITLVRSDDDMEYALHRLGEKSVEQGNHQHPEGETSRKVLGFDTETRPSFRKGTSYSPSLIQIALEDEVFLFHLKWRPFGQQLISLLEGPDIIKTGVAICDDMLFLSKISPFKPASVLDLGEVARNNNIENRGLRGLAAVFLGLRISKGEQCSNWGNSALSPRQIRYAATDAWISRAIYFRMLASGLDFTLPPPQPESKNKNTCKLGIAKKRSARQSSLYR